MRKSPYRKYTSDLACERARADTKLAGVEFERREAGSLTAERVRVKDKNGENSLARPIGSYFTLHTGRLDRMNGSDFGEAVRIIADELWALAGRRDGLKILAVGLGARELTPDTLGPKAADRIVATAGTDTGRPRCEVAVIAPGTAARTGLSLRDIIVGVGGAAGIGLCLAIDALACTSEKRLGSCIQISDTGIIPGSGVGEGCFPINRETVGIPVIAIGAPTLLRAEVLSEDGNSLEEMLVCDRHTDAITDSAAELIASGINLAFGL
ncbi:MAG: GPR endopeptidase [Clostridia bacterium]|nr:GPR endopeptidase [Clostridia bacterium]